MSMEVDELEYQLYLLALAIREDNPASLKNWATDYIQRERKEHNMRECYVCWGNGYVPKDIEKGEWEECSRCDGTGKVKIEEVE